MLERMPAAIGKALSGLKAGLEKAAFHADFADVPASITLASPAFADGAAIPARFTEDADSPTPQPLVHLIAWNLAATTDEIAEGGLTEDGSAGFRPDLGRNSFLKDGWLPPDPPTGHGAHRYAFQVYALDRALDLPASPGRGAVIAAMKGHVLGKGLSIGTYARIG